MRPRNKVSNLVTKLVMCPGNTNAPALQKFSFSHKQNYCAIWTIIELKEDIMVLNNMTMFHKILIKTIQLREWTSLSVMDGRSYFWILGEISEIYSSQQHLLSMLVSLNVKNNF